MPWGNKQQLPIITDINFEQIEQDIQRANDVQLNRMYRKLRQNGGIDATDFIGTAYLLGCNGLQADINKALSFLYLSAEGGSATAQHYLGDCYAFGLCVPSNPHIAHHYYRLAAQSDVPLIRDAATAQLQKLNEK